MCVCVYGAPVQQRDTPNLRNIRMNIVIQLSDTKTNDGNVFINTNSEHAIS